MPTHLLAGLIVVAVALGRVRAQVLWTPIYLDSNSEYIIVVVHSAQAFVITFNERGRSFIRTNGAAHFYFCEQCVVAAANF
jgi:hypothetical protein